MLLLRCCTTDGSDTELTTLLRRLECVTKGILLSKNSCKIPVKFPVKSKIDIENKIK